MNITTRVLVALGLTFPKVTDITASFNKVLSDLETAVGQHNKAAVDTARRIGELVDERSTHIEEARRADVIKQKIEKLVDTENV